MARDFAKGVILDIRDCHRDVMLVEERGRMMPSVLMGQSEKEEQEGEECSEKV